MCNMNVMCNMTLPSLQDNDSVLPDGVLPRWPVGCPAHAICVERVPKPSQKHVLFDKDLKRRLRVRVRCRLCARLGAHRHDVTSTLA